MKKLLFVLCVFSIMLVCGVCNSSDEYTEDTENGDEYSRAAAEDDIIADYTLGNGGAVLAISGDYSFTSYVIYEDEDGSEAYEYFNGSWELVDGSVVLHFDSTHPWLGDSPVFAYTLVHDFERLVMISERPDVGAGYGDGYYYFNKNVD